MRLPLLMFSLVFARTNKRLPKITHSSWPMGNCRTIASPSLALCFGACESLALLGGPSSLGRIASTPSRRLSDVDSTRSHRLRKLERLPARLPFAAPSADCEPAGQWFVPVIFDDGRKLMEGKLGIARNPFALTKKSDRYEYTALSNPAAASRKSS
jgi:hypothetical protein